VEFENTFEVTVPPEEAWVLLMDIERIAPCVPGAELTEVVDDKSYKGKISVKLGPVALTFNGQTTFEEINETERWAKLKAQGNDSKGRGGAHSKITFRIEPAEAGAKITISTSLQLSGAVAQYGRGVGMIEDLAQQIISQFAENLEKNVISPSQEQTAGDSEDTPAPTPSAAPIQAGSMGLKVIWNAIVRGIKKLFGG
jgi:hypothetical protein